MKAPPSLTDTKGFEQYDTLFMQLSDDRRTVNAFELQVAIIFIVIWIVRRLFVIFGQINDRDLDDDTVCRSYWRPAYPMITSKVAPALKSADRFVIIKIQIEIQIQHLEHLSWQVVVAMDRERGSLGRLGYSEFKDLIVSLKMWQVP